MMPARSLVRAFLALSIALGAVIIIQSVQAVAALFFLIPRTMRIGAVALVAIFALAFGLHALGGQPNLALLVYAAGVLFVRNHVVKGYRWQVDSVRAIEKTT